MNRHLLLLSLLFLTTAAYSQTKLQSLQRVKIVKTPAKGEDKINAQLSVMDAKMQAAQASIQKAQSDDTQHSIIQNIK